MKVFASAGREDIATVYLARMDGGKAVEFVESVEPPVPRSQKWVLIVSTLFGCPVRCRMCDAGGSYQGRVSKDELFAQIDYLVGTRFPSGDIPAQKFKIQFARIGEPALNPEVIRVLEELPGRYRAPGLMPCVSTVAPEGTDDFFRALLEVKQKFYRGGKFQLQFSIHTTDEAVRDWLVPVKKWNFDEIAAYGEEFYEPGDRKVALNFALAETMPVEAAVLLRRFDPDKFLIKITPVNPTHQAAKHNLATHIDPHRGDREYEVIGNLRRAGYEVLKSIGEAEENLIGSNCGQYLIKHLESEKQITEGYTYTLRDHS